MNRNNLRCVLPGAMLLAALGLVACDGGTDAGMGAVDDEGTGTGVGTYQDQNRLDQNRTDADTQYIPPASVDTQRPAMDTPPAGEGGINDDQMTGSGAGEAWDGEQPGTPETERAAPLPDAATQPQGTQTPAQP